MRCTHPHSPAANDDEVMRESLAARTPQHPRRDLGPSRAGARWHAAAPTRVIQSISFLADEPRSPNELRKLFAEGRFAIFGEIGAQYRGLSLDAQHFLKLP
jgi:hypothetical protein